MRCYPLVSVLAITAVVEVIPTDLLSQERVDGGCQVENYKSVSNPKKHESKTKYTALFFGTLSPDDYLAYTLKNSFIETRFNKEKERGSLIS